MDHDSPKGAAPPGPALEAGDVSAVLPEFVRPGAMPFVDRKLHISRDRVEGLLYGIAIGDAMGFPVEILSCEEIRVRHGYLNQFVPAPGNHLAGATPAGTCTDDTQLTLAVMEALLDDGDLMTNIAMRHVEAMHQSVLGWGGSTREAVERLERGIGWDRSGVSDRPGRGVGNGVIMKMAPLVLFIALDGMDRAAGVELLRNFAAMTHATPVAAASALAHAGALIECLASTPQTFSPGRFIDTIKAYAGEVPPIEPTPDGNLSMLMARFEALRDFATTDRDQAIEKFGAGSSNVFDSLPFTYQFFLRDPATLGCMFELVNAGGDTDSNAAVAASLLGALHGKSIFPEELRREPDMRARIDDVLNRFCNRFGIS